MAFPAVLIAVPYTAEGRDRARSPWSLCGLPIRSGHSRAEDPGAGGGGDGGDGACSGWVLCCAVGVGSASLGPDTAVHHLTLRTAPAWGIRGWDGWDGWAQGAGPASGCNASQRLATSEGHGGLELLGGVGCRDAIRESDSEPGAFGQPRLLQNNKPGKLTNAGKNALMQPCGLPALHRPRAFPFPIHCITSILQVARQGRIFVQNTRPAYYTACTVHVSLCFIPIIITVRLRGRPGSSGPWARFGRGAGQPTESCGEDAGSLQHQGEPLRTAISAFPSLVRSRSGARHGSKRGHKMGLHDRCRACCPALPPAKGKQAGRWRRAVSNDSNQKDCVLCCQKTEKHSADKSTFATLVCSSRVQSKTPARLGGMEHLCAWLGRRIKPRGRL